jgi:hypothetical protein
MRHVPLLCDQQEVNHVMLVTMTGTMTTADDITVVERTGVDLTFVQQPHPAPPTSDCIQSRSVYQLVHTSPDATSRLRSSSASLT